MTNTIYIVFILFSFAALLFIENYIVKLKEKKQLHVIFLIQVIFLMICNIGYLLLVTADEFFNYKNIVFEYILFFGATFASVFLLFLAITYKNGSFKFNYKHVLLIIPQVITNIVLWTNEYHHMFYKSYGISETYDFGSYFYIAMVFVWINIISATIILVYASIKNSKAFSRQAQLMIWGSIIPVILNGIWVIGNVTSNDILKFYSYYDLSPIALSITAICCALAIFRYGFLDIAPIALQKVVDCISDSYFVINSNFELVDYNNTFSKKILEQNTTIRKTNIIEQLKKLNIIDENIMDMLFFYVNEVKESGRGVKLKSDIKIKDRIYIVEITPIKSQEKILGIIVLFKDITELTKAQNVLIEQERLVSLGQLAGGMAHDINTPIAAIRTGLDFFKDRYSYTERELEMLEMMKISAEKITDIVSSVRSQIRNMGENQNTEFCISKVLHSIELLLKTELEKDGCKMSFDVQQDIQIVGDEGKLTQIIMNIVTNAAQAYGDKGGEIKIRTYKEGVNGVVEIADKAGGIPEKIVAGLFKEILTTKGTKGTGFGLYFSQSMLKAAFGGEITFETEQGIGTVFCVRIPIN